MSPAKGVIRYHHDVNLNEVRSLTALMTWKTALVRQDAMTARPAVLQDQGVR